MIKNWEVLFGIDTVQYVKSAFANFNTAQPDYCRRGSRLLGALEDRTPHQFGFKRGANRYTVVYLFEQPWVWDKAEKWDPKDNPWVLMFMGCDDTSYFLRFQIESEAEMYSHNLDCLKFVSHMNVYN